MFFLFCSVHQHLFWIIKGHHLLLLMLTPVVGFQHKLKSFSSDLKGFICTGICFLCYKILLNCNKW